MRKVYVVLSDTQSVLTRLIKLHTKSPYNHASISFDSSFSQLYSFGRKQAYNPFMGGFVVESFYSGTFKRFKDTRCMVLSFEVEGEDYSEMQSIISKFQLHQDDYHYNFIGLIGLLFNYRISRQGGYYCSEFVAEVIKDSSLYDFEMPPYLVRPDDFRNIMGCEIVYEGKLSEYSI